MANKFQQIINNHWTVTIFATMIGVFSGIYFNGVIERKNMESNKNIALENIIQEIERNREMVSQTIKDHTRFVETLQFMLDNMDEEENLIADPAELAYLQAKYPDVFDFEDSTKVGAKFRYNGDINMNVEYLLSWNLSNLAWETLQGSNLMNELDFDCLMKLNFLHTYQEKVKEEDKLVIDFMKGTLPEGYTKEGFAKHMILLIEMEKTLLEAYEQSGNLSDCF